MVINHLLNGMIFQVGVDIVGFLSCDWNKLGCGYQMDVYNINLHVIPYESSKAVKCVPVKSHQKQAMRGPKFDTQTEGLGTY